MSAYTRNVMIVGATSAIARAVAARYAAEGATLFLIARNPARLATVAADLRARGAADVGMTAIDLVAHDAHRSAVDAAYAFRDRFDAVLVAHGNLPDQEACEREPSLAADALATNATSVIAFLLALAPRFETRGGGCVAVIGSVAGDRGRRGNYVYGAAKAAVETFLQGFRIRMAAAGARVVTIKPGFVDTPMTAAVKKNPLFVGAGEAGMLIHRAMETGKRDVVYVPWFWECIMLFVRMIPEPIFRRMRL